MPPTQEPQQTSGAPIFVVGIGRSGTTLMRLMLSAHPRIYICHELAFYLFEANSPRSASTEEVLNHYLESFKWLGIDAAALKARLPKLPRWRSGLAFREVMRDKAASYGKVRFGDKSPYHTNYLGRMLRDFPDARIILMVRDPRALVPDFGQVPYGSTSEAVNALVYEIVRHQVEPFTRQVLRVKLEDLVGDPRAEMQRVLEFVGEEWDEAVLHHQDHVVDKDQMPPVSFFDDAMKEISAARAAPRPIGGMRRRTIEILCRKSIEDYGYEKPGPASATDKIMTWLKVALALPEFARYARAMNGFYRKLGRNSWQEAWLQFQQINPKWWSRHPQDQRALDEWVRRSHEPSRVG